jgi:hypothetical protein
MRRQRAEQRIADRLLVHLNSLSSSAVDWAFTPSQRIVTCLRGTFEATVLLWSEVISDDPRISIPERLLQSFVHLLNTCLKFDNTRAACQDIGVAGPLVLAIGVAAGAAPEMEWYNKLQQQAKNLVSDPQVIFNTWLQNYGGRARLLLAHARGGTNLEFWLRQSLRLLGQVDPLTRGRQESRWGLLLKVYNAEYAGDASVSNIKRLGQLAVCPN